MRVVLEALHQGDYDTAFDVLVRTLALAQGEEAAEVAMLLAEAYSLYGEGGIEGVNRALEEGLESSPGLEAHPRYRSLLGEVRALEGASEEDVRRLLPETDDPQALYHQAQALMYLGLAEEALGILERPLELPAFLRWRAHTLRGKAYERLGKAAEAAWAYKEAARLAVGMERYWNLIDAAAMFVEAGMGQEALETLHEAASEILEMEDPEDAATRFYLEARSHLLLGNPGLALEAIQRALERERQGAEPAYGTPLVHGQTLMQLGQPAEAVEAFREAVRRAEPSERSYALHELAVAYLEAGKLADAEATLREVLRDPEYGYQGEAYGDLAETLYRQGRYEEAEQAARQAILLGNAGAGYLILGNLAYDLMHYEEALEHYTKACEEAPEGSRDWITAQQMVVDTLAQLGFRRPEEIVSRSEAVLPYIHPSDEWHQTLSSYAERARNLMGGSRTLN
ncbi:MAG: tetratricopeptide repeat protein [Meiothermus sp.]|uniref:tetratricopeptide repeat protein n=1 Tax=Meiothermus sp. TaxID=1955249 RepID=UPI0025F00096|nr:tetratricopeptide repeat protein [Meiothermus sp.]MCS7058341.1 tetratricopeptide repeat protein [Meiothermus sp.]MCS7194302.1 tetratricopeptide repeat protein [Meiothermus sp.]MCX7740671.1 tetratricopeptide repeat protein [Meiothermus sp.]MDW8090682.1 tetratricopeptide repeat protein [Meiothermus sp.]MDW8482562.1 tetratricopeptide repeat protein [Meiothermus sp.]